MYDKEVSFMFIHRSNDQSASFPKQLSMTWRDFFIFLLNFEGKQVGPVRDKVTSGEKNNEKAGGGGTKTFLLRSSGGNTNRFQVSVPFPLPYAKRMHCLYRHREKLSHPLMKVIVDPPL